MGWRPNDDWLERLQKPRFNAVCFLNISSKWKELTISECRLFQLCTEKARCFRSYQNYKDASVGIKSYFQQNEEDDALSKKADSFSNTHHSDFGD